MINYDTVIFNGCEVSDCAGSTVIFRELDAGSVLHVGRGGGTA